MSYVFNGNLKALLCDKYCTEVLAGVKVRLYRTAALSNEVVAAAAATPKETFHQVSDEEAQARAAQLLAETLTDEQGNFTFSLGEKERYSGEAFDIDFVCGNVPRPKPYPKRLPDLQFHITTLAPRWQQRENNFLATWVYVVPARWWCLIRGKFDAWVVCGRVTDCKTQKPMSGLRVYGYDVDWLQDDALGFGTTDANGYFRIDYTAAQFSQTILSPLLNIEWPAGPDIYFKIVEPVSNITLLAEDRSVGHSAARTNRGHCFCVELCVPDVPATDNYFPALWERVGSYNIYTDVNANGYTNAGLYAFTGGLSLNGQLPSGTNSNSMQYRFRIYNADTSYELTAAQVKAALPAFKIGELLKKDTTNPPTNIRVENVVINPLTGADADGWITVPRQNDFSDGGAGIFSPNGGVLAALDTAALALDAGNTRFAKDDFNIVTPTLVTAGQSVPAAALGSVHTFKITFEARELGGSVLSAEDTLAKIVVSNVTYLQRRHPSWNYYGDVSGVGAGLIEIQETTASGNGCGTIGDALTVNFTVAHPHMDTLTLSLEGNPTLPAPFSPVVNALPQLGGSHLFDTSGLEPCAYIVWLHLTLRLTNGSGWWAGAYVDDHIAFCKKPAV